MLGAGSDAPDPAVTEPGHVGTPDRAGSLPARDEGPEAAEIGTQEQVRGQDDCDPGNGRIREALQTAAAVAEQTGGLGTPGRPVNRRSPFMIGMTGAFGVAVAYGLVEAAIRARSVLIITGLALFIAVGLDPVVGWLVRHRIPRWAAVLAVIGCGLGIAAAFLAAAIPPLTAEVTALTHQIPHYMHSSRTGIRSSASSMSSTTSSSACPS